MTTFRTLYIISFILFTYNMRLIFKAKMKMWTLIANGTIKYEVHSNADMRMRTNLQRRDIYTLHPHTQGNCEYRTHNSSINLNQLLCWDLWTNTCQTQNQTFSSNIWQIPIGKYMWIRTKNPSCHYQWRKRTIKSSGSVACQLSKTQLKL